MVFWAVFFAVSILVAQNGSDSKPVPMGEVFFVSSQKELNTSLKQEGQLRGLAVSVNFYQKSSEETKTRIEGLVERKLLMRNRPVFIYGQPFSNDVAKFLENWTASHLPLRCVVRTTEKGKTNSCVSKF